MSDPVDVADKRKSINLFGFGHVGNDPIFVRAGFGKSYSGWIGCFAEICAKDQTECAKFVGKRVRFRVVARTPKWVLRKRDAN